MAPKLPVDKRPPADATIKVWHRRLPASASYHDVRGLHFSLVKGKRFHLKGHTDSGCDVLIDIDAEQMLKAFESWKRAQG
jgi:hypothetical protein